jgi:hypothetical protein
MTNAAGSPLIKGGLRRENDLGGPIERRTMRNHT